MEPTQDIIARVGAYMRDGGHTAKRAAAKAGVAEHTLRRWRRQGKADIAAGRETTPCAKLAIEIEWAMADGLAPAEKLLHDRIRAAAKAMDDPESLPPQLHALGDKAAQWMLERLDGETFGARTVTEIVERRTAHRILEAVMPHMSEGARRELLAALDIVGVAMDEEEA